MNLNQRRIGHVQHVRPNRDPPQKGSLQARKCLTAVQHFLAGECLLKMACCHI